jgi:septal ring factor EnvC (AmiA/AmiB activator)
MTDELRCPCGDFRPGDPSYEHSVRHTPWLHRNDVPSKSTSAQLREAQTALAASQADLTRVEKERDELGATLAVRTGQLKGSLEMLDLARAELASAQAELERLRAARQWAVARDGGRYCECCEQEVKRGHAYDVQPGTGGLIQHIYCPDRGAP